MNETLTLGINWYQSILHIVGGVDLNVAFSALAFHVEGSKASSSANQRLDDQSIMACLSVPEFVP